MAANIPSEQEVLGYFKSLSNWGRWGDDDELGTLNFLTPEKTKKATTLVEEGVTVSCARTVMFEPGPDVTSQPVHYMVESGEGWATGDKVTSRVAQGARLTSSEWSFTDIPSLTLILLPISSGRPRCTMVTRRTSCPPAWERRWSLSSWRRTVS